MSNSFALAPHDEVFLKSESLTKPLDRGWRIAIAQARYHRCFGVLRETGHDNLLSECRILECDPIRLEATQRPDTDQPSLQRRRSRNLLLSENTVGQSI